MEVARLTEVECKNQVLIWGSDCITDEESKGEDGPAGWCWERMLSVMLRIQAVQASQREVAQPCICVLELEAEILVQWLLNLTTY